MPEKRTVFMWDKDGQKFSVPEEEADWATNEGGLSRVAPPNLGKADGIRGPLTTMEKAILIAKDTLRTLPETVGMTIGGTVGGVMGGPPGAIAGGAGGGYLGTKVGQAARSMWPGVFGQPPATHKESVEEQFQNMAMGGVSEAIPAGLGKLAGKAIAPGTRSAMGIAEREGIPFTAADVDPQSAINMMENLALGSAFGAKPVIRFREAQAAKLMGYRQRIMNAFGPLFGREQAGEMAKKGVQQGKQYWFSPGGYFDRAYEALSVVYKEPLDTEPIRKLAKEELDDVMRQASAGRLPSVNAPNQPSRYIQLLKDLSSYGLVKDAEGNIVSRPITYAEAWREKQAIDAFIDWDDPLRTRAKAMLQRLRSAFDQGMESAAAKTEARTGQGGIVQKIREVNKLYGETKNLYEVNSLVADIDKINPEQVIDRFFPTGKLTPAKDLFQAIDPKQQHIYKPMLQRRVAENLFEGIQRETVTGVGNVQIVDARKLKHYLNKNREALSAWFEPDQLKALEDLANVSALAQASSRLANPASGRQVYALWQLLTGLKVGTDILQGDFAEARVSGAGFIAPHLLGYALTNPTVTRHLIKGFRVSPGTQEYVRWCTRLAAYYKMLDDQYQRDKAAEEQRRGAVQ